MELDGRLLFPGKKPAFDRLHSAEYLAALKSDHWKELRRLHLEKSGGKCVGCGAETPLLSLHHVTYDRLGHEEIDDVILLCAICHEKADKEREYETRKRIDNKRLDAWATKVYGDDWACGDVESIENRFWDWVERQG